MPKMGVVAACAAAGAIVLLQFTILGLFADLASSVMLFGIGFAAGKFSK